MRNSDLQRFTNKWTNGLWECNVSFCIFGALFSASELKSQDLLASGKHHCGQANIWEPFLFGAKNRSLNKIQAESASKQGWNASLRSLFANLKQFIYVFLTFALKRNIGLHLCKMLSWILSKSTLKLLQNISSNQGWHQCHGDSTGDRASGCNIGILRTPPCLGIKELLTLDMSLHFSRSEIDWLIRWDAEGTKTC